MHVKIVKEILPLSGCNNQLRGDSTRISAYKRERYHVPKATGVVTQHVCVDLARRSSASRSCCTPARVRARQGRQISKDHFGLTELILKHCHTGPSVQYGLLARFQTVLPFGFVIAFRTRDSLDKHSHKGVLVQYMACSRRTSRSISPRRQASSAHRVSLSRA